MVRWGKMVRKERKWRIKKDGKKQDKCMVDGENRKEWGKGRENPND